MKFFKSKKFIIPVIVLLIVGGMVYRSRANNNKPPEYETLTVAREDLKQTVDGTGKVESLNNVNLRFEIPGTIASIDAKEGVEVKAGQRLANVRLTDLDAAVAHAEANLNQKLAGATEEDKKYYAAAVESAKAALEQAKSDAVNSGGDMVIMMQSGLPKLDDALTQADNILGVDNSSANADFKTYLSVLNPNAFTSGIGNYSIAKRSREDASKAVVPLMTDSSVEVIKEGMASMEKAYTSSIQLLSDVSEVLKASVPNGTFTQTVLDSKKTIIENTRTALTASYSSFVKQKQLMNNGENNIKLKEAAYAQAVASYESRVNPPREVDLAGFRAALAQARANREKGIIKAPMDGIVTKVNKKIGETVSGVDSIIEMLSPHYEVKVDIPETDVPKIKVSNKAEITLDAFGEDTKFTGTIISIDPSSTEIQDVVYYRVRVSIADTDKPIKPGMTANVSIDTAASVQALSVPQRSVRTRDSGAKFVRVLENGIAVEKEVTLGLKANEGKIEVTSGLNEGDQVILSSK